MTSIASLAANAADDFSRARRRVAPLCRFSYARTFGLSATRVTRWLLLLPVIALAPVLALGVVTGSISGTVRDASGAVIPGVSVTAQNMATGVSQTIVTDSAGFYNFPALAIGHYNVSFRKAGFREYQESGAVVNVNTFLRIDAVLEVGTVTSVVTVTGTAVAVNTRSAQMGEVIGGSEIVSLPLNGRAYTDLLALQPGVVPINVARYGSLSPSGNLDNGVLSMSGHGEVNNGFMVNGANAVEGDEGGTTVVPNLDSIAEFRILTNNAGAEYGNYSGGLVNVATKTGTNQFHGDAFEFLRNSGMDSRNFFSADRGVLRQNMFGATFGGPIAHNKAFFFVDYQGTRQEIGVDTGLIAVPSQAERSGDFSDVASEMNGTVNGQFWANTLASKLGYPVTAGEPYYTAGCTSSANCVFPNAVIPSRAWSPVSSHYIPLIPLPNSGPYFSTSAYPETLQDDKGGIRVDGQSRFGMLSAYYMDDPWTQVNPYGSTVPGFPDDTVGKAQLLVLSDTTSFGSAAFNQFTFSYMRNKNIQGLGVNAGPSMASLGFAPPAEGGIYQPNTQYQNYPELSLNNYTLGPVASIVAQFDNTYQWQDDFTKIVGTHTLKFGADYHMDQDDIAHPNNGSNGGFSFSGAESGYDFADMLIGATDSFFQGTPAVFTLRNYYLGLYAEDSWRATRNLTFNYGLRWELSPGYWSDSKNRNPDIVLGDQSVIFPGAPKGYVYPGDPGVPPHFANTRYDDFGPRFSLAYAPSISGGPLRWLMGGAGKSSIRAGFGMYYTNIQGKATWNFDSAPYGLFYSSPAPPLLAQPFITRASGQNLGQRFPIPGLSAHPSPSNPDSNINWAQFLPISGIRGPLVNSPTPYSEDIDFSIERQFASNTLLSLSYIGTFGHHLLLNTDANPGDPALCLGLSKPSEVMPGTPTCGPFGENGIYYPVTGGVVNGTRGPFGPLFAGNGYFLDVGNSDYHALEATLRRTAGRAQFLISYTYSKAMDNGSGYGDQLMIPGDNHRFENLSVYDMTHNFTASYTYELPFDSLFRKDDRLTRGWRVSGITEFTTGIPISISNQVDRNLRGDLGNSPFSGGTDEPNFTPGQILEDTNPRDRKHYFNTALFSQEPFGGEGNSARRFFHGPGINNWDLALLKDVRITESKTLEFRGEFFNAFNHAQFYGRVFSQGKFNAGPGTFGMINQAAAPRIAQVALKLIF